MTLLNSIVFYRLRSKAIVFGSVLAVSALGQFQAPVVMAPIQQLKDEFGETLQGHARAPGDLAVAYWSLDGVAHPPNTDGTSHPYNIAIPAGRTGVGALTPRSFPEPGVFNLTIVRNKENQSYVRDGNKMFVRIFNAPTVEEASFYTDSQVLTQQEGERFRLVFSTSATDQPLDPGDDDNDGLNNSWEKSLGTDRNNPDTDGDGMSDGDEFFAGTDANSDDSVLEIRMTLGRSGRELILSWQSVSGRCYQVEADAFLTDTKGFESVPNCDVRATSAVTRVSVPAKFMKGFYNFRVNVQDHP